MSEELVHLEHRLAVLTSFLDVMSDPQLRDASGQSKEGRIFRGCMDGAIATCRALSERFGITVYSKNWDKELRTCSSDFKDRIREILNEKVNDCSMEALWEVLVAANRCICHLEDRLIDHNVKKEVLVLAIHLVQDICRKKSQILTCQDLASEKAEDPGHPALPDL
ncbi:MAG: hypothetical protein HC921_21830 [Synechococcaceae cyanobacterium SM2_3_1]|nr:hypothetical protein [Synechococcaceae cyanobacterium SM2_3_1]